MKRTRAKGPSGHEPPQNRTGFATTLQNWQSRRLPDPMFRGGGYYANRKLRYSLYKNRSAISIGEEGFNKKNCTWKKIVDSHGAPRRSIETADAQLTLPGDFGGFNVEQEEESVRFMQSRANRRNRLVVEGLDWPGTAGAIGDSGKSPTVRR